MKKSKSASYSCYGINNAISIFESQKFFIEGIDILKKGKAEKDRRLSKLLNQSSIRILEKKEFDKIYAEKKTQGIVVHFSGKLVKNTFPNFSENKNVCLLVLDRIEDPQNFGQIIRTVECAGLDGIIFSKHHSAPISNTVLQVSQGAFANVNFYEMNNLSQTIRQLKKENFWVIGLENGINAKPWYSIEYLSKTVIIVGSEGRGIRKKILESCDFISTIPMQGKTNSLNVSAAVSALTFERLRQIMEDNNALNA